jgi:hypothetical protein
VTIAPSDVITFVGTIKNGVISASSIIKQWLCYLFSNNSLFKSLLSY